MEISLRIEEEVNLILAIITSESGNLLEKSRKWRKVQIFIMLRVGVVVVVNIFR